MLMADGNFYTVQALVRFQYLLPFIVCLTLKHLGLMNLLNNSIKINITENILHMFVVSVKLKCLPQRMVGFVPHVTTNKIG